LKALFLDRDGVINIDSGYVSEVADFIFKDNIFCLLKKAIKKNYIIIIVTNQSGIGRGYYSLNDYIKLNEWMLKEFKKKKILVTKTYFCPHHPTKAEPPYNVECYFRKPNPGMFIKAKQEFNIDMSKSIMLGDKITDMQAAISSGIVKNFLLCDNKTLVKKNESFNVISNILDLYETL
jgi:D-glycero-D-manno-heptose 1,7-bisphosphate phosphatase